MKMIKFEL